MRLMRVGPKNEEIPVVVDSNDDLLDLRPLTSDFSSSFLETGGLQLVQTALMSGKLKKLAGAKALRVGAPIPRPQAVICIGQNYAAHAAESGDQPPAVPIVFFKHPNTVVGPYDGVLRPPKSTKLDWEVELGVVIGKRSRYLKSPDEALDYIAGFVVSHDVSERNWQIGDSGGQWSKGKCGETFNPLGPQLVTPDEIPEFQTLRIWSRVNGEARQDSTTADMIFGVRHLVWHLSQYMVLEPGDLINTGTPQGVALSGKYPFLEPGDRVELGIQGLGSQEQEVVQAK